MALSAAADHCLTLSCGSQVLRRQNCMHLMENYHFTVTHYSQSKQNFLFKFSVAQANGVILCCHITLACVEMQCFFHHKYEPSNNFIFNNIVCLKLCLTPYTALSHCR